MGKSDGGVYFAFTNWDGNTIQAYKYSGDKGLKQLGDKLCYSASSPTNVVLSSFNGSTVALYREANGNRLYVKKYDEKTNSWSVLLNGSKQANNAIIEQNGKNLYLLQNGSVFGKNESYLYVYDMSLSNGKWTQVGTNMVMDASAVEMALCFNGSQPYVIYSNGTDKTYAKQLSGNQWAEMGLKVSSQQLTGLKSYYSNGKAYVTYLDLSSGRISVRALEVSPQEEKLEGWQETGGKKYYYENGKCVKGIKEIGKEIYFFDDNGVCQQSGWITVGTKKYFPKPGGAFYRNQFIAFGTTRYYMGSDGSVQKGIVKVSDGTLYYANKSTGVISAKAGWIDEGTKRYFCDGTGKLYRNQFISFGTTRYYMGSDGSVQKGIVKISNGTLYYANKSTGVVSTKAGWIDEDTKRYFCDGTGKLYRNQFIAFGTTRYYMGSDGSVQKGVVKVSDGTLYYANKSTGVISAKAGWIDEGTKRYFCDGTGKLYRNQFISFGTTRYYMGSDGSLQKGIVKISDGNLYYANKSTGVISAKAGWIDEGTKRYFCDGTGKLYRNQFISFGTTRYYMGSDGSLQKGIVKISDGNLYYANKSTGVISAKAGWIDEGTKRYFCDGTGKLYRNQFISFGKIYYYCGSDGAIIKGQKYMINGIWYTFDENGIKVA